MARKIIHISLKDDEYFCVKEQAKKEHLKVSTWARQKLLELLNNKKPELPFVALPYYKEAKAVKSGGRDRKLEI